ncbi:MAG: M42 family metallopeptidase [Clostridiaceae bacterium]|nr:M42 family metallopeptidase [Clostridiaceae bacterium]
MDTERLIGHLCDINALVGNEKEASEKILEFFRPYCDKAWGDPFFNVIGYKKGEAKNPKKVMITAHYDQIGLIVAGYEKNGFLSVSNLGGVDTKVEGASCVTIHGRDDVFGVIGAKPPHLLSGQETKKNLKITELFIDTGLSDDVLKEKVSIGDPVSIVSPVVKMKNGCLSGRNMDNRCGVAALVLILEQLQRLKHDNDIYVIATVQEETGSLGAMTAAYNLEPDVALVIDVTHGDMPDAGKSKCFTLGKGIPVGIGPAYHRQETNRLLEIAGNERIPTSLSVESGDPGTESWAIQVSRLGVATVEVSIPLRYMHTGVELVKVEDVEMAACLAAKYSAGEIGEIRCGWNQEMLL